MEQLRKFSLLGATAALLCGAGPAGAVEPYRPNLLPVPAGFSGKATGIYSCNPGGGLLGVIGTLSGGNGSSLAVFWGQLPPDRAPDLVVLPAPGASSAGAVACAHVETAKGTQHRPVIVGSVTGGDGSPRAAGWVPDLNEKDRFSFRMILLGGPGSEANGVTFDASASSHGRPDRLLVVGRRHTEDGGHAAMLSEWDLDNDGVSVWELPGLGGGKSEADEIALLPDGGLRIAGCSSEAGQDVEVGCIWEGSPGAGFTVRKLPTPGGAQYAHVSGMSPQGNFVVGVQFRDDGTRRPVAWGRNAMGEWSVLELNLGQWGMDAAAALDDVNSSGIAVGASSYNLGDTGTHEVGHWMNVSLPPPDQRAFMVNDLIPPSDQRFATPTDGSSPRMQIVNVTAITEERALCGAAAVPGDPPGVLRPLVILPDPGFRMLDVVDPEPGEEGMPLETATFWRDDRSVSRSAMPGSDTTLRGQFLGSSLPAGVPVYALRAIVVSRLEGRPDERVGQTLCLWNYQTGIYDRIGTEPIRGGRDQVTRYRLPADLTPYLSPTGMVRIRLRWTDFAGRFMGSGFTVHLNMYYCSSDSWAGH